MTERLPQVHEGLRAWDRVVLEPVSGELRARLDPDEHSALAACLRDCFDSLERIYSELLPTLASRPDRAHITDVVHDIASATGELQHVKKHITDAERGLGELLRILEEREARREGER